MVRKVISTTYSSAILKLLLLSPFELSQILPVGGSLLVLPSLPGPPVVKITHASDYYLAWPGWVVSVFPLTVL